MNPTRRDMLRISLAGAGTLILPGSGLLPAAAQSADEPHFVLMIVLIGFVTFFVIWIVGLVFMIQASMAASRGEWYRYPINIRLVSGAVGG